MLLVLVVNMFVFGETLRPRFTNRRDFFVVPVMAVGTVVQQPTNAFQSSFPVDLQSTDTKPRPSSRKSKQEVNQEVMGRLSSHPFQFTTNLDIYSSLAFTLGLYLLAGSRSSPLLTGFANLLYDPNEPDGSGDWVKDRNEGLFSDPPLPFLAAVLSLFSVIGLLTDKIVLLATSADAAVTLQFAVLMIIAGGFLEIGRIATKEKALTRSEDERETTLANEFATFASEKLQFSGSTHKTDVTRAFRLYYGKYRTILFDPDDPTDPVTDVEIERLLKSWARTKNVSSSGAGFYKQLSVLPSRG